MRIFNRQAEISNYLRALPGAPSIGFVPTMGALHQGHLSLLERSLADNQVTVISIFVNPTQFNNPEDLEKYPRTLDSDVEKIKSLNPDIIVFAPTVEDMYPEKTASQHFNFDGLENQMEGKFRAGHFDGVGTIVKRLLEIVGPQRAYFGEKDFQQLQIVRKLVEKHNIPVEIIGCPVFREESGLAMSSRNERLAPEVRRKASVIYKTLQAARKAFGKESAGRVAEHVRKAFAKNPDFKLEYFEIADIDTLKPVARKNPKKKYRAFIAVFAGNVRLIDTIPLN